MEKNKKSEEVSFERGRKNPKNPGYLAGPSKIKRGFMAECPACIELLRVFIRAKNGVGIHPPS
ncbi:MAG: hypothetical protein IJR68_09470, partial [Fretibacterium sp.]|nr:hypothetical protein [Fretibacterium sp.]